jgi:signal transduction histidine kinase
VLMESASCGQLNGRNFDLAVVGGIEHDVVRPMLESLQSYGSPVVHVSRLNGHSPKGNGIFSVPQVDEWPELLVQLASQILERERATAALAKMVDTSSQTESQASLGRYILEMRHNLNNALTSILGNSELMLLDCDALSPNLRQQIETIRNMGMRMNEILQRFSSLEKEMQLVKQQSWKKVARAGAGV